MSREAAMAVISGEQPIQLTEVVENETQLEAPKDLESSRLAIYAKKEAKLVKDRQELDRMRREWEEEKTRVKPIFEKGEQFQKLMNDDIYEALKLMGKSDTEIFNLVTKITEEKQEPTAEDKARLAAQEEIKKFEEAQAAKEKDIEDKRNTQLVTKFRKDISAVVESDKEKFEYCNHYGPVAEELIYDTILAVLEESKGQDFLSVKEAAELVENNYEEQDKLMSSLNKRKPKAEAIQEAKEAIAEVNEQKAQAARPKTLTNRVTATTKATSSPTRKETSGEKRERLENMLRNLGK